MSAITNVIQMVRSHVRGDDASFYAAADSLARGSKVFSVRRQLEDLIQEGRRGFRKKPCGFEHTKATRPSPDSKFLATLPEVTFSDLLLPAEVQASFDEIVEELEYRTELAERGLRARDRILLCGPPGNGKSSSAAAIASALGVPAFGVGLPQLIDKFLGGTGANLGELFASLSRDTLVVFDEIDAIGSQRVGIDQSASKEQNSVVNTMLTLLDRNNTGIIVATTNRVDILDPALVRRFEEVIELPAPSYEQMTALASRLCAKFSVSEVYVGDCLNFDAVTKRVKREARKQIMWEILASEREEDNGETE